MKPNLKIIFILIFQLIIILILVGFGTAYVQKLAVHSESTIKDNLRSVRYCAIMQKTLNELHPNPDQLSLRTDFENNLKAESDNITEQGEKELVDKIQSEYFLWLKIPVDTTYNQIVNNISAVNDLNINAIEARNTTTQKVASQANTYLLLIGFFGALAAMIFTFTFIGQLIRSRPRS